MLWRYIGACVCILREPRRIHTQAPGARLSNCAGANSMSLLAQIAIFLAAAVVAIPIFRRFKLGSVLGYLAAGIIIGPACFGFIKRIDGTLHIAEFGIVLLMFVIGLELQPSRLWVLRKPIFGLGFAQVLVTTAGIGSAAYFGFEQTRASALVIGFGLSMSSTALVLQVLA